MSTARDIEAVIDRLEDIRAKAPDEVYDIVCMLKEMRERAAAHEKQMIDILNRLAALRIEAAHVYVQGGF